MNKIKKSVFKAGAIIFCLLIVILIFKLIGDNRYKREVPRISAIADLTAPLKEQLLRAERKVISNPSSDNLGLLGMTYNSCSLYDEAIQCYSLAIKRNRSKWIWSYYLGYLHQEMGDSKAAIENFKTVVNIDQKVYMAWYYLGNAYYNNGSPNEAENALKKVSNLPDDVLNTSTERVNFSPLPISARFELARIYLNSNRIEEAEKILTRIVASYHTIGPVYRLLGNVYSVKGDSSLSRNYITRAKDLAEVTTVNDTLIDKLALMSRSDIYLLKIIDDAMKTANPEWALKLLNNAMKYFPDDKYLVSKAVKFFLRMNAGKEALPFLANNFNDFNNNFNEMREIADLLYKKGFSKQALPYFRQMNKLKPEYTELQINFAHCYWMAGLKDSSLLVISKLNEMFSTDLSVLSNEADFMIKTEDYTKAKSLINKLQILAPTDPRVAKLTGMVQEKEGDISGAISSYEKSFRVNATDLETTKKLGQLLLDQKLWAKAVSMFRESLSKHPNEPFILERLGTLLIACPDPSQRDVRYGLELSERAFFAISSSSETLIAAGKSLAQGFAIQGNFQAAAYYIGITLNMAQNSNVPKDYLEGLKNLAIKINQFSHKK